LLLLTAQLCVGGTASVEATGHSTVDDGEIKEDDEDSDTDEDGKDKEHKEEDGEQEEDEEEDEEDEEDEEEEEEEQKFVSPSFNRDRTVTKIRQVDLEIRRSRKSTSLRKPNEKKILKSIPQIDIRSLIRLSVEEELAQILAAQKRTRCSALRILAPEFAVYRQIRRSTRKG
jgi:hypothetical protein